MVYSGSMWASLANEYGVRRARMGNERGATRARAGSMRPSISASWVPKKGAMSLVSSSGRRYEIA